jgi:hypothetical protein
MWRRQFPARRQATAEAAALQKALDAKAPKCEIKAALDKHPAARQTRQSELLTAMDSR